MIFMIHTYICICMINIIHMICMIDTWLFDIYMLYMIKWFTLYVCYMYVIYDIYIYIYMIFIYIYMIFIYVLYDMNMIFIWHIMHWMLSSLRSWDSSNLAPPLWQTTLEAANELTVATRTWGWKSWDINPGSFKHLWIPLASVGQGDLIILNWGIADCFWLQILG